MRRKAQPRTKDGIGDMVEEMNQTVRTTVEKGAAHAERLGENLKESIQGMRAGRDNVVMVRVDDNSKAKLDELLDAGLVNSRSEAAAFLIGEGIKSRSQLFDTISGKVEDIRKKKEELRRLLEEDGEATPSSEEPAQSSVSESSQ